MKKTRTLSFYVTKLGFILVIAFFTTVSIQIYKSFFPRKTKAANLTSVSATLSNPRLSFRAGVTSGSSGSTLVTIDNANQADVDTNHLFRTDSVCFTPSVLIGCRDNIAYSVASVPSTTTFNVSPALTTTLQSSDFAIATQSGTLTLTFTLTNAIPSDGDILITIPMADNADGDDGFPDWNSSGGTTAYGGFDLGEAGNTKIGTGDVSVSETCSGSFTVSSVNVGSGTSDHTIDINNGTASCEADSTITITIGNTSNNHLLINPAPQTSGRSRGEAEIYNINIKTRDSGGNTIDESDTLVAPIEGVFVSATVDESLAFTVTGVTTESGSYCGSSRTSATPKTTAYTIPWGTLSTTYSSATHNTQQVLEVTTNADGGYKVYIQERDQMGKNGVACPGTAPSSGDYTFSGATCIRDTVCSSSTCTHIDGYDWGSDPSSYPGMGYSLENVSGKGSDAKFLYNYKNAGTSKCDTSGNAADFCAKQIADYDRGSGSSEDETADGAEIMTNSSPVDGNQIRVCFRIDLPGTQPAGYYYSTILYTAVPIF